MSGKKKQISEKFNKLLNNFLSDLQSILPEEKDIAVFKSQIAVATMISENKVLKSFIDHVFPYKEHIMSYIYVHITGTFLLIFGSFFRSLSVHILTFILCYSLHDECTCVFIFEFKEPMKKLIARGH